MIGFGVLTLIYLAAIVAASYVALVGGMFLHRAGFRQPFHHNPGYAMLTLAVLLGLIGAITNPSVYLSFGNAAAAIFTGFVSAVIGTFLIAAVGYLLSPERVSKYYERTQGWLNSFKAAIDSQGVARRKQGARDKPDPPPASEEQKLDS